MECSSNLPIAKSHECPGCGQPVICGLANGQTTCWCMQLDRVLPVANDPGALCYCEVCLRERIAAIPSAQSQPATA